MSTVKILINLQAEKLAQRRAASPEILIPSHNNNSKVSKSRRYSKKPTKEKGKAHVSFPNLSSSNATTTTTNSNSVDIRSLSQEVDEVRTTLATARESAQKALSKLAEARPQIELHESDNRVGLRAIFKAYEVEIERLDNVIGAQQEVVRGATRLVEVQNEVLRMGEEGEDRY